MTQNQIKIRLNLDGELAAKFDAIKKRKGLKNNTEVVRYLISALYHTLEEAA
jgi:metal-responsive CopG/Arc/MetJ family transcriptional regulator